MSQNQQQGLTLQRPSSVYFVELPNTVNRFQNILPDGFGITSLFPVKEIHVSLQYLLKLRTDLGAGQFAQAFDNTLLTCNLPCFNDFNGIVASLNKIGFVHHSNADGYTIYCDDFNESSTNKYILRDPTVVAGSNYNFQLISPSPNVEIVSFSGFVRITLLG